MAEERAQLPEEPFEELIDAEPSNPTPAQVEQWISVYERVVAMLDRQIRETHELADSSPEALRRYFENENLAIITEELDRFTDRLEEWRRRR